MIRHVVSRITYFLVFVVVELEMGISACRLKQVALAVTLSSADPLFIPVLVFSFTG
jgi:hypothetical protein